MNGYYRLTEMQLLWGARWRQQTIVFLLVWCSALHVSLDQVASTRSDSLQQAIAAGSAALQKGDYAEAERDFRSALASDPNSIPILNNLAISIARQQREKEAIALYEGALHLKPDDSVTQRNLGVAYFRDGQYKLALPLLETFAKESQNYQALDLTGLDLFALDRYEEAAQYLEAAHKLQPSDLQTLDMLGKAYMRAKNYSGATEVFSQIMAINPNSAEAHVMLAMAYDKSYREDDAIKELEAARAVDPHYPGLHTGLGIIYWRSDNIDAAEREFQEELSRYPKDPIANCTMGRILKRRNESAKAIPYFEAALAVNPSYRDALLELGETRILLEQPSAAIQPLERLIAFDPDDAEAHYILGTAYSKAGNLAEGAKQRAICARIREAQNAQVQKKTLQSSP